MRAEATPGGGFYLTPGPAGFEDGTLDYLGIPAIGIGLDHISSVGVETIHARVMGLTGWLLKELLAIRHSNGAPLVRIYGPAGTDRRGATIAMNFLDPAGALVDSKRVECHYQPPSPPPPPPPPPPPSPPSPPPPGGRGPVAGHLSATAMVAWRVSAAARRAQSSGRPRRQGGGHDKQRARVRLRRPGLIRSRPGSGSRPSRRP